MEALKWIGVALASLIGGYLGHKVTGSWASGGVALAAVALCLTMAINAQWALALVTLAVATYGFFSLMDTGSRPPATQTTASGTGASMGGSGPPATANVPIAVPKTAATAPAASETGPVKGGEARADNTLKDCAQCPPLAIVPPGKFEMGGSPTVSGAADPREAPRHPVSLQGFAAGRGAVSKAEFAAFVDATKYQTDAERNGGCFGWIDNQWRLKPTYNWRDAGFAQGDDHPAVCISWNDAQAYAKWLSQISQRDYRLLSEAEREYATRADTTSTFWWGEALSADRANYDTTGPDFHGSHKGAWRRATVPVNSFAPNAFGLYNVHGNVWEWVQDCHHDNYTGAPANGSAWTSACSSERRVMRGGGWALSLIHI